MQETLPQKDSRSTVQKESLFAFAGLTSVAVLHRTELLSLAPAKWATISGWLLLLAGVWIASALDRRFEQMLRRLYQREAIARSSDKALLRTDFEQWLGRVRSRAHAAGLAGSIVFPAMLLVAYACVYLGERLNAMDTMERVWFIAEVTIELICARMVGRTIGRGISYGFLGKHLASDQVHLNVIPGHSDNTAGLRPIGDFYFYQATVTALPVVFFAFWILMMPAWTTIAPGVHPELSDQFSVQWKNTYLVFLFVALGIEVLAFLLPLWFFHREMATQKKDLQSRVDELSASLSKLQREMTTLSRLQDDGEERAQLVEQISLLENLPTWALAPEVRQRFAWGNIAFLSPFAMQISQTVLETVS